MVTLRLNVVEATILEPLSSRQLACLRQALTYTDRNKLFLRRTKHIPVEPQVCLLQGQTFPAGLSLRVAQLFYQLGETLTVLSQVPELTGTEYEYPEWLWEHQKQLVAAGFERQRGVMKSPTGSGKTKMLAMLLKHYPEAQCLVTVPSEKLLTQTAATLQEVLQEPVGQIGDGKKRWQRVTVGIINSLSKLKDESRLRQVQVLLFDECHLAASAMYVKVGQACTQTTVRLGVSARPQRSQGDDMVLEGVIGPLLLSIEETDLTNQQIILQPDYLTISVPDTKILYEGATFKTDAAGNPYTVYPTATGKPELNVVTQQALVQNPVRNRLILECVKALLDPETNFPFVGLCLVENISHGELLKALLLQEGLEVPFIHGKSKDRERVIQALCDQQLKFAIASRILNEGVDIPPLGAIFITGGGSSPGKITQQVGRVVRQFAGKTRALVVDFQDEEPHYLRAMAQKRLQTITKLYRISAQAVTPPTLKQFFADRQGVVAVKAETTSV